MSTAVLAAVHAQMTGRPTVPSQDERAPVGGPPQPTATALLVLGPVVVHDDATGLGEQLGGLLRDGNAAVVICDVGAIVHPDAATIDVLARLQLTARRLGGELRLYRASGPLRDLLAMTGLDGVLPVHTGLLLDEAWRQAEQREQPVGVEEGVDPDDLPR